MFLRNMMRILQPHVTENLLQLFNLKLLATTTASKLSLNLLRNQKISPVAFAVRKPG